MKPDNFRPMTEVDCHKASALLGITTGTTTVAEAAYRIGNRSLVTAGVHANEDLTVYVKDTAGNVVKKVLAAGSTYPCCYVAVWTTANGSGVITAVPDENKLNLIF